MKFFYKAINKEHQLISGILTADHINRASAQIIEQGFTPLHLEPYSEPASWSFSSWFKARRSVSVNDLLLFSQQMASMLKAGVPIFRALSAIEHNPLNNMAFYAENIRQDIESGQPLAQSLSRFPECFDPYYVSMIKVGESTGQMDLIFSKLHDYLAFQKFMKDQIKTSLRYPIVVISIMLIALLVVNFFVIPSFGKVYAGFHAQLPWFTQLLIQTSHFFTHYWWTVALGIGGTVFSFRHWIQQPQGRLQWDRIKLKLPLAGPLIQKATLARLTQSLSISLQSGLPISSALSLVSVTTDNAWIVNRLQSVTQQIESGTSLYVACSSSQIFTPMTLQMILVGEESGDLDRLLYEISQMYKQEVEYQLTLLSSQIEPILLLFLGGLVLILALGLFLPIWNLSSAAFPH